MTSSIVFNHVNLTSASPHPLHARQRSLGVSNERDDEAFVDGKAAVDAVESRKHVHLPPLVDSNFVVHYRQTDFHVHSLVLLTQSTYFRSYLSTQPPLKEVHTQDVGDKGKKRRRVTAFTAIETCAKCGPSSITRCIDLPDEFGIEPTHDGHANEDVFLLFLRYLYFSSVLHIPPFTPGAETLSALTDDTPVCLTFPSTPVSEDDVDAYCEPEWGWSEQLLSLFHYFDCQAVLRRCEAVIACMTQLEDEIGMLNAWDFLPVVVRYGLKEAEAACLVKVGTDSVIRLDSEYDQVLGKLSPAITNRVIEALSIHIDSLNKKIGKMAKRG